MRYVFVLCTLLAGCASRGPEFTHNGEPTTWEEYQRAKAECELAVGGENRAAVDVCVRDKGYRWWGS
ncbi:hypothetical protein SVA_1458 [Sulfurifustis variabilis]|uniref:Lipoprotein n=1 Tax=Sulfurifustis variabilis TaxID=1675686 RepID=A0A1B4VBI5_9GAMM|nr:hypothetical protein [Sulfurifustis variabilis]BAU48021.1 hypothetical protein SVA_1458 [Sulfurifustis variabilis]